jgi:hypothetical protein
MKQLEIFLVSEISIILFVQWVTLLKIQTIEIN